MSKIKRNLSTPESRKFWEHAKKVSVQYKLMLSYKRGGTGPHPLDVLKRIEIAAANDCWLELSSNDVKKLHELLTSKD